MPETPHEDTRFAPVSAGTPKEHDRGFPNACPYCGDSDLWPHRSDEALAADSPGHGEWECRSCLRAFRLKMLGQIARPGLSTEATP